jgi:hypothetical protein
MFEKIKKFLRGRPSSTIQPPTIDLEEVWRIREEEVYPSLFGTQSRGIFPLSQQAITDSFGAVNIDPRWLFYGAFEFAPTPARPTWLYVTSGHSNPWESEPSDYKIGDASGRGVEFVFVANEPSDLAIRFLLHMLAYDLLLVAGQLGERRQIDVGALIPLGGAIDGTPNGRLRNAFVVVPPNLPKAFELPSGQVRLLTLVGITDEEFGTGSAEGGEALVARFQSSSTYPLTVF